MNFKRIVGERTGTVHGPLMVIFTYIHGNEPAGFKAVNMLFDAIDEEYIKNPNFDFRGKIVALYGNMEAMKRGVRYVDKDLNRNWKVENVERIFNTDENELDAEDKEMKETLEIIRYYLKGYQPSKFIVLDLHTTTADGGIFTIPSIGKRSRQIALGMNAPVLHGFLDRLQGTTLHYFSEKNFGLETASICFEGGQHQSQDAVYRAVSAIIRCFTSAEGFYPEDIEMKHENLLVEHSKDLPREANLVYIHPVRPEDDFRMREDKVYRNFDPIKKGELLAYDKNGEIKAPFGGLILMPLYQKQGSDGFFIIQILPDSGDDGSKVLRGLTSMSKGTQDNL